MLKTGLRAAMRAALMSLGLLSIVGLTACTGSSSPSAVNIDAIAFQTTVVPDAGAGEFYNTVVYFVTAGNAAPPDTFNVVSGELPTGMSLIADREDADGDGQPDPDGALTGNARLVGFPRVERVGIPYNFVIKAISTGQLALTPQPPGTAALAAEQPFQIEVFQGSISILNPTFQEGSNDPAVPAFPDVINFVNPADPQAFFSFAFETAGGTGNNVMVVYLPRELELSVFDTLAARNPDDSIKLEDDTDESAETNDKFTVHFSDGGVFNLQAGNKKVQIGGFQSPRGEMGKIGPLDTDWFQRSPGAGGPPVNSRRDFADTDGFGPGDGTLGTGSPVLFSDYFSNLYEGTNDGWTPPDSNPTLKRRKYPFVASEYSNAFDVGYDPNVDPTPLRYNAIVEAIDTRGTPSKVDDIIARKAYIVQVRIPDIVVDSVFIVGGTAGLDYNVFVAASGGVPPLQFDLEYVDGTDDAKATENLPGDLNKDLFGVELDQSTGGFFGRPRASGFVDLSVRVFAEVMNPSQKPQSQSQFLPTGGTDLEGRKNEWNGWHPLTVMPGIHKTFKVEMLVPSAPAVLNPALDAGVDGSSYRAADGSGNVVLKGAGGVPQLIPYPVGFVGSYPSTPVVSYAWTTTYDQDASYDPPATGVDGLPNNLTLDGDIDSATNGEISGTALDRGFHAIAITQTDTYVGDAANPSAGDAQNTVTVMGLSVSPDTALYLRGLQSAEGSGGTASGLLEGSKQIAEARMVPLFLQAQLFRSTSGQPTPEVLDGLPPKADILPVGIPNGGSRVNVDKSEATIQGFWPAEAGREQDWGDNGNRAWRHLQQEMTWIQIPDKPQHRVFMWGETSIKKWDATQTTGMFSKRYQTFVSTGERGILIVEPGTGKFWIPGKFSNAAGDGDGARFGSEFTQTPVLVANEYDSGEPRATYRPASSTSDRVVDLADYDHHGQDGLGSYIENLSTSINFNGGWYAYDLGRGGVSVAVSDDGLWCATAMPGGDQQKIAIWRTDGKAIDADDNIFGDGNVTGVDGIDSEGDTLTDTAGIINVGGGSGNDNDILPDSLKFVEGGLIFMRFTDANSTDYSMHKIFGFSLKTGALTNVDINTRKALSSNVPLPSFSLSNHKNSRYVPDQDHVRGRAVAASALTQWAWAGNKADAGEAGPNSIAFTGGEMYTVDRNDYSTAIDREGFRMQGNRRQSLFFMTIDGTTSDGLNLTAGANLAKITDLTGNDSDIYGDLLTPGRPGEMLDFLKVSGNGKYVALVRDWTTTDYSGFRLLARPTFAVSSTGTSGTYLPSHDILLFSTTGDDLDAGKGGSVNQHVLFVGQNSNTSNGGAGPETSMPKYASANNLINARWRRIFGLDFSQDDTQLFFEYASSVSRNVNYNGRTQGWGVNPTDTTSSTFSYGTAMIARFNFRTSSDGKITFKGGSASSLIFNPLKDLKGVGGVGPTTGPFGGTDTSSSQLFWARFRSPNGDFLYYVSDVLRGPAHMFGINMTDATITSPQGVARKSYVAFATHGSGVKFEQFEVISYSYESRFAASPAGTSVNSGSSARDADGIVFVIAGDATSAAAPETDLEVYAFDANRGGALMVLTSDVTDSGTINAINNLYVSMDGNTLIGQRATSGQSRDSRSVLTAQTDLFAVSNVHEVLAGGTPKAFIISAKASHGSTVALVGEGTGPGPQAIIYSHSSGAGNTSWDDRQLYVSAIAEAAPPTRLDAAKSHYVVLAGSRKLDDDPDTAD